MRRERKVKERRSPTPRRHFGESGRYALTREQADALITACSHLEDRALLSLALATGMRREDVVSIRRDQVDLDHAQIQFHERKKNVVRKVKLGGKSLDLLRLHMDRLPKNTPWLFPSPTRPSHHVSDRTAYNILQRWLVRAELPSRPFHALRATCVKLAKSSGWTIEQVMDLTGDSFEVIKTHYDVPSDEEMAKVAKDKPIF
jgi:integrase